MARRGVGDLKRLCIVHEGGPELALDFIRAHVERLPCQTQLIHGVVPAVDGRPLLSQATIARAMRKASRIVRGDSWSREFTKAYLAAFRAFRPDAVLAEWGPVAVRVMEACDIAHVPLVAHFHGYDVSVRSVLETHQVSYPSLFRQAGAVVGVSRDMCSRLIALGADQRKVHHNAYGVDLDTFTPALNRIGEPVFVAVGRFVEKKAPHLTIAAFARALKEVPSARLVMLGDGPLLGACGELIRALGIDGAVDLAGFGDRAQVVDKMRHARAFVQHSITASDGDAEGTPNTILEAGAMSLPVIATRHAGIPEVVLDGETGLLVDEFDVLGMARHIVTLGGDGHLAATMGKAARQRIERQFTMEESVRGLWAIIEHSMRTAEMPSGVR